MIIGIGADLCDIRRIERVLARHGDRFLERVFTESERARAVGRAPGRTTALQAGTLAKRFAAKEACSKALGTGFRMGVFHSDLGVVNRPGGQPAMVLTGGAARRLQTLLPDGMQAAIHLTMTDEYPYAFAQVMIEGVPSVNIEVANSSSQKTTRATP